MAEQKIEIGIDELTELSVGSVKKFPKYVKPYVKTDGCQKFQESR
ncbi:MAG: hypothetical protein QXH35_06820 [Nitrososphaerota archaeon]